jgi:hypothetical protein
MHGSTEMSEISVSHQSLAQSLLSRKWGLQVDDDACTVVNGTESVGFDFMGMKLLKDRDRLKSYVRQIVSLEISEIKAANKKTSVDDLELSRVTNSFSPIVASHILPLVKKQLKSALNMMNKPEASLAPLVIVAPPPSPVIAPPQTSVENMSLQQQDMKTTSQAGSMSESRPTLPLKKSTSRLIPYDDFGDPTDRVVDCDADTIIGRKHFDRNSEVLSTISRKWLIVKMNESSCVLCKYANSCPIWYSKGDSSLRVALKSEILLDEAPIYIYHDRNDTALCHIEKG